MGTSLGIANPVRREGTFFDCHLLNGVARFWAKLVARDDSTGFNQEAAHEEFGIPGFIRAAWLYKVPLSSRLPSLPLGLYALPYPASHQTSYSGMISFFKWFVFRRNSSDDV